MASTRLQRVRASLLPHGEKVLAYYLERFEDLRSRGAHEALAHALAMKQAQARYSIDASGTGRGVRLEWNIGQFQISRDGLETFTIHRRTPGARWERVGAASSLDEAREIVRKRRAA
jgi:hypothetical protein